MPNEIANMERVYGHPNIMSDLLKESWKDFFVHFYKLKFICCKTTGWLRFLSFWTRVTNFCLSTYHFDLMQVMLLDVFVSCKRIFLVLEYASRGTLADLYRKLVANKDTDPFMEEAEARYYYHDIMNGLEYLHRHNIAHRWVSCNLQAKRLAGTHQSVSRLYSIHLLCAPLPVMLLQTLFPLETLLKTSGSLAEVSERVVFNTSRIADFSPAQVHTGAYFH